MSGERVFFRIAVCALLATAAVIGTVTPSAAKLARKGNVLLITIDTLRADRLSCYGFDHVRTDRIDRLAAGGTIFTRAFTHTPTTLPSHTNILLGTTPLSHGVHDNSGFVVRPELWTLAEHLKKQGYRTAAFVGAYPLDSRFGLDQGFDLYDDDYGSQSSRGSAFYVERKAEAVVGKAMDWLAGNQASPWFLWIHCFDPHEPYNPPPPFDARFRDSPYDGEVAYVDSSLGPLFARLEETKLLDNTLVVLTGDHGESLGEHGESTHAYFAYNATIWVPLIIRVPGMSPGRSQDYVAHIDIFPTICDALDIKPPSGLPGISLLPAVRGKKLPARPLYFESLYPYYSRGWAPLRGIIQDRKKYIDSPIPEFYDLTKDSSELANLAGRADWDDQRESLKKQMERAASSADGKDSRQAMDAETMRKLRSLGYVSGQTPTKRSYGPRDDIKMLLPFHNKSMEAKDLLRGGQAGRAEEMLKAVIAERKDIDVAYSNLATLYKEQGRLDEAVKVLEDGLAQLPSNFAIFSTYINFLVAAGRFDDVIEAVTGASIREMEQDPEIWNYLGIAYANKGAADKALEAFETGLAIDPSFASIYVNRGTLFLSQFLRTKDAASARKAADDFAKAVENDPQDAAAFNGMGVISRLSGKPDDAVRAFEKALDLKPGYRDALYNLGMACLDINEPARAERIFVDYRKRFANGLSQADRQRLEELIRECRRRSAKSP